VNIRRSDIDEQVTKLFEVSRSLLERAEDATKLRERHGTRDLADFEERIASDVYQLTKVLKAISALADTAAWTDECQDTPKEIDK